MSDSGGHQNVYYSALRGYVWLVVVDGSEYEAVAAGCPELYASSSNVLFLLNVISIWTGSASLTV